MNKENWLKKILTWGKQFSHFACYPGNGYDDDYHQYDLIFAAGAKRIIAPKSNFLPTLFDAWQNEKSWLFGYIGYDVKNEIEKLHSKNTDAVGVPNLCFFEPEIVGCVENGALKILVAKGNKSDIKLAIENTEVAEFATPPKADFTALISKKSYLEKVRALQNHIQQGDIYEVNFCQEFFAENVVLNPIDTFFHLNQKTRAPFAAFWQTPDLAVLSASPERYLQKVGDQLISQPIKGTAKRSANKTEDESIKTALLQSEKERAENVMIVDLVRNDLSRVAADGSVNVPELFGVYSFPTVHQLISTVTAKMHPDKNWLDVLQASFPMGSMTGAPKVRAMQLIEDFEAHKRGIYSGALGYISPAGNFDFNVVIRSLVYNKNTQFLSASVGGAITILANAEDEYDECLLKAKALLGLFK